ncbi:MAG TPA: ATP-binding protein [Syntrophales bacterium]|nr:ATP-binding protein [Syntrophales bacterium]
MKTAVNENELRRGEVLEEKLRIKNSLLSHIYEISSLLTRSLDLEKVLDEIADRVVHGLNYDRAMIMLLSSDGSRLECRCIRGFTSEGEKRILEKPLILEEHDCYETKAVRCGNPRFIPDTENAPDATPIDRIINRYHERKSVLYVPLRIKDKILGLLGVDRYRTRMEITQDDVESLTIFANQASIIIENTRLYQALSHEKKVSENIIRCSTNGVVVSDLAGGILNVNPRAEELLGIPREEAVKTRIQDVFKFNAADKKKIYSLLKKSNNVHYFDYPYSRNDEKLVFNLSGFAFRDEERKILGAVTIIADQTEKKRMDDYLLRVEKSAALGRVAAGIAHEIRNPLAGIYTTVQNLENEFGEEDSRKSDLQTILQEIDRVERLIREILDLVRPVPIHVEEFDIHNLLSATLSLIRKESAKKKIDLIMEFNAGKPSINADPHRLRQVFLNLVLNAIESIKGRGKIIIRTDDARRGRNERDWISISFQDSGRGIPPENMSRIFEPFFTTKSGGTGLGLPVSHKIIEDHRGMIEVESEPDRGAVFRVLLPLKRVPLRTRRMIIEDVNTDN